jgi:hypothetical protein
VNLRQYNDELRELEKSGVVEVKQTRDGREVNFTEPGEALAEIQIAWDEKMQLFLFQLYWTDKYGDMENSVRKLIQIAEDLKEAPGINILRTLENNQDKLNGLEFKDGYLPEDLVKQFDPETDPGDAGGE